MFDIESFFKEYHESIWKDQAHQKKEKTLRRESLIYGWCMALASLGMIVLVLDCANLIAFFTENTNAAVLGNGFLTILELILAIGTLVMLFADKRMSVIPQVDISRIRHFQAV